MCIIRIYLHHFIFATSALFWNASWFLSDWLSSDWMSARPLFDQQTRTPGPQNRTTKRADRSRLAAVKQTKLIVSIDILHTLNTKTTRNLMQNCECTLIVQRQFKNELRCCMCVVQLMNSSLHQMIRFCGGIDVVRRQQHFGELSDIHRWV